MDQGGDTYQEGARQVDEQLSHNYDNLFRPEIERRTAIRQTVPTKASVEAETSTIINKKLFFNEFYFEIVFIVHLCFALIQLRGGRTKSWTKCGSTDVS